MNDLKGSQSEESIDLNDPEFLHFVLCRELQLFEEKLENKLNAFGIVGNNLSPDLDNPDNSYKHCPVTNKKSKKPKLPKLNKRKKAHPYLAQQVKFGKTKTSTTVSRASDSLVNNLNSKKQSRSSKLYFRTPSSSDNASHELSQPSKPTGLESFSRSSTSRIAYSIIEEVDNSINNAGEISNLPSISATEVPVVPPSPAKTIVAAAQKASSSRLSKQKSLSSPFKQKSLSSPFTVTPQRQTQPQDGQLRWKRSAPSFRTRVSPPVAAANVIEETLGGLQIGAPPSAISISLTQHRPPAGPRHSVGLRTPRNKPSSTSTIPHNAGTISSLKPFPPRPSASSSTSGPRPSGSSTRLTHIKPQGGEESSAIIPSEAELSASAPSISRHTPQTARTADPSKVEMSNESTMKSDSKGSVTLRGKAASGKTAKTLQNEKSIDLLRNRRKVALARTNKFIAINVYSSKIRYVRSFIESMREKLVSKSIKPLKAPLRKFEFSLRILLDQMLLLPLPPKFSMDPVIFRNDDNDSFCIYFKSKNSLKFESNLSAEAIADRFLKTNTNSEDSEQDSDARTVETILCHMGFSCTFSRLSYDSTIEYLNNSKNPESSDSDEFLQLVYSSSSLILCLEFNRKNGDEFEVAAEIVPQDASKTSQEKHWSSDAEEESSISKLVPQASKLIKYIGKNFDEKIAKIKIYAQVDLLSPDKLSLNHFSNISFL